MSERIEKHGKSLIVYDDSLVSQVGEQIFNPSSWAGAAPVAGSSGGRGTTYFISSGPDDWVLRHYYRGGVAGRLLNDEFLWLGQGRTRPMCEWALLSELQRLGLPAPVPVAARSIRTGIYYRADLITRRLPGVMSFLSRLQQGSVGPDVWAGVGSCIGRFHAANIFHADLNAHNIQIDDHDKVFLLDFDRGRKMSSGESWQTGNMARLQRSLRKISADGQIEFGPSQWEALQGGYDSGLKKRPQA